MTLRYWLRNVDGDLVDITGNLRKYTFDMEEKAEEGSVAVNSVTIDDPDATLDIKGFKTFAVEETSAVSSNDKFVFLGHVGSSKIIRGPYRTGVGRQWQVEVSDVNALLSRPVMVGRDNDRPAETDVARIQWVEGTSEGDAIDDTRYLSTLNPVNMDANNYLLQTAQSVYDDAAQQSGKNYFLTYFGDVGVATGRPFGYVSLYYDFASGSNYPSTARLSNVASEVDMVTTFPLGQEDELLIDPMRVYSKVIVPYKSSYVTAGSALTASTYQSRDVVMNAPNVSTRTQAQARANRYIRDLATPDHRATVHTVVPRQYVNLIRPGMNVPVKATHWPEPYASTFTDMRVLGRRVVEISEDNEETYQLILELSRAEPAPPAEAVNGILYKAHGPYSGFPPNALPSGVTLATVYFEQPGDTPPAGQPLDATSGLITALQDSGATSHSHWQYWAWRIDGTGTVDIHAETSMIAVRNRATSHTVALSVIRARSPYTSDTDFETVGSETITVGGDGTGLTSWTDRLSVVETGISVIPDDILLVTLSCSPMMAFFRCPAGTGGGYCNFEITGGSLA